MKTGRYDRQIRLPGFGPGGQERLSRARVLVVGAGGLGVPACSYLNAMGVGTLGIADGDRIEESNLHRQPLYTPSDCGKLKAEVLGGLLKAQNPETEVVLHPCYLEPENALAILSAYDLVVDATDRIPTRYLLDDACVIREIPWVYGALHGFEGQMSVFNFRGGPTYRCLYPIIPNPGEIPDCNLLGTLGVLPGIIGTLQALEAVKVICNLGSVHSGKLLLFNALDQQTRHVQFGKTGTMGQREILAPSAYDTSLCATGGSIPAAAYRSLFERRGNLTLIDVREEEEFEAFHLPGSQNIPLGTLENRLGEVDSKNDVYLICQSGSRSAQAFRILEGRMEGAAVHWIQGGIREVAPVLQEK